MTLIRATAPSRWASTTCAASASCGRRIRPQEEVAQEYERMWRQLGNRPIEALLDLPPMTDPVACATMDVLTMLVSPALFTDENLRRLVIGRMANLSLEHGNSDASCLAYVVLGTVLGPRLRRLRGRVSLRQARPRPGRKAGIGPLQGPRLSGLREPSSPGRGMSGRAGRCCGAPSTRRSRPATSPTPAFSRTTSSRTFSPAAIRSPRCSARPRPGSTSRARRGFDLVSRPDHRAAPARSGRCAA